jgi:hypothetical protein
LKRRIAMAEKIPLRQIWGDTGDRLFNDKAGWMLILPSCWQWLQGRLLNAKGKPLSDLSARLLQVLWWKARASNEAKASVTYLCRALGRDPKGNRRPIRNALRELQDAKLIVPHPRVAHPKHPDWHDTTVYDVAPSRKAVVCLYEAFQCLADGTMTSADKVALEKRSEAAWRAFCGLPEDDDDLDDLALMLGISAAKLRQQYASINDLEPGDEIAAVVEFQRLREERGQRAKQQAKLWVEKLKALDPRSKFSKPNLDLEDFDDHGEPSSNDEHDVLAEYWEVAGG